MYPLIVSAYRTTLVIGVQHHKLGHILLAIFDPKIPRVGGSRSTVIKAMEVSTLHSALPWSCFSSLLKEQIKSDLRELCGIGLYNRWTPPGIFTASMGIAICKFLARCCIYLVLTRLSGRRRSLQYPNRSRSTSRCFGENRTRPC